MLALTPYLPEPLHFAHLDSSSTNAHFEVQQLHALSLKTNILTHPKISSHLLTLYTHPKINNLAYAKSIFDRIPYPTLYLYNVLIKCCAENQKSHEAIALFRGLLDHGLVPDSFVLPVVLKGCAKLNAIGEGKQVHGLVVKFGCGCDDEFVQSGLISMYAKCGEIERARNVFDRMRERDLVSWNALIDGYAKCGEMDVAMNLFEEMPERDLFSWTVLVDGFSKCGRVETAREIFDRMPDRNLVSWNAMINGYMKCRDVDAACELLDQMPTRNLITFNSMIAGYELNGRFVEALEMFKTLLKESFVPNHSTLVSVLSALSGLAVLSKGRLIHSYMIKKGVEVGGVLGTLLIEMYAKCGSIESALTVFHSLSKKKVGHWTSIIVGLGMHGLADLALKLFHEMCSIGLKPHAITFVGVLNACSHAGLVDDGRKCFEMMVNDYGIEPSIEHYGCLVDILCRAGCLEEAKDIIRSMPMRPNSVIWMSLLSGARKCRNTEIGEYAADKLIKLAPDSIGSHVVLSNIYAAVGQWNRVSQVRETMKKRGVKKDPGCSSIEHRGLLHEFTVGDKSHPQTKEIYSKLSEIREKLKRAGHVPDTTQVLLCLEEERQKEAELENHSERLAIAFGLINVEPGSPIRIIKNLRICNDCHAVTKLLSDIYNREIIVRDNSRFHHFKNGLCSCNDFW